MRNICLVITYISKLDLEWIDLSNKSKFNTKEAFIYYEWFNHAV